MHYDVGLALQLNILGKFSLFRDVIMRLSAAVLTKISLSYYLFKVYPHFFKNDQCTELEVLVVSDFTLKQSNGILLHEKNIIFYLNDNNQNSGGKSPTF